MEPFDLEGYRVEVWIKVTTAAGTTWFGRSLPEVEEQTKGSQVKPWTSEVRVLTRDGEKGHLLDKDVETGKT